MSRKSQAAVFIILGVILVFTISFVLFMRSGSHSVAEKEVDSGVSFATARTKLENYVGDCLKIDTQAGINNYGLISSEEDIAWYINENIKACTNSFAEFRQEGYEVDEGDPVSTVSITPDAVVVSLDYPVKISKGDKETELSSFQYNLDTNRALSTQSGLVKKGTIVPATDGDAVMKFEEDTRITDLDGNPLPAVSFQVMDSDFGGFQNSNVIGAVVYEGLPSGARFDPAVTIEFKVKKEDKPDYLPMNEMKCAYWDSANDIWRTYLGETRVTEEADGSYLVSCNIDHFSAVAIVDCALRQQEYLLKLSPIFKQPIEPAEPKFWSNNVPEKGGNTGKPDGIHLLPEGLSDKSDPNVKPGCSLEMPVKADSAVYLYSGDGQGKILTPAIQSTPEFYLCDKFLLQDWDNDDKEAGKCKQVLGRSFNKDNPGQEIFVTDLGGTAANNGIALEKIYYNGKKITADSSYFSKLGEYCHSSCKEKAWNDLKEAFPLLKEGKEEDNRKKYISGDGINDNAYCTCKVLLKKVDDTHYDVEIPDAGKDNCYVGTKDFSNSFVTNIDNLKEENKRDSNGVKTMESVADPKDATVVGFYATPKTYGYATTKGAFQAVTDYSSISAVKGNIKLGGYAEYRFTLKKGSCADSKGTDLGEELWLIPNKDVSATNKIPDPSYNCCCENDGPRCGYVQRACDPDTEIPHTACTQERPMIDASMLALSSQQGAKPVSVPKEDPTSKMPALFGFALKDLPWESSDQAIWTLNEENPDARGKLKAGENIVRVYVNNIQDPAFYANAYLKFKGKGISVMEECGITSQQRINEILKGCDGKGSEVSNPWSPDTPYGRELNCLALYRNWLQGQGVTPQQAQSAGLCTIDYSKTSFIEYAKKQGAGYCDKISYDTSKIGTPGLIVVSPNGACQGGQDYCPDILNAAYTGCQCGGAGYSVKAGGTCDKGECDGTDDFCCMGRLFNSWKDLKDYASAELGVTEDKLKENLGLYCRGGDPQKCWCRQATGKDKLLFGCKFSFYSPGETGWVPADSEMCRAGTQICLPSGTYTQTKCDGRKLVGCGWDEKNSRWDRSAMPKDGSDPKTGWGLLKECAAGEACDSGECCADKDNDGKCDSKRASTVCRTNGRDMSPEGYVYNGGTADSSYTVGNCYCGINSDKKSVSKCVSDDSVDSIKYCEKVCAEGCDAKTNKCIDKQADVACGRGRATCSCGQYCTAADAYSTHYCKSSSQGHDLTEYVASCDEKIVGEGAECGQGKGKCSCDMYCTAAVEAGPYYCRTSLQAKYLTEYRASCSQGGYMCEQGFEPTKDSAPGPSGRKYCEGNDLYAATKNLDYGHTVDDPYYFTCKKTCVNGCDSSKAECKEPDKIVGAGEECGYNKGICDCSLLCTSPDGINYFRCKTASEGYEQPAYMRDSSECGTSPIDCGAIPGYRKAESGRDVIYKSSSTPGTYFCGNDGASYYVTNLQIEPWEYTLCKKECSVCSTSEGKCTTDAADAGASCESAKCPQADPVCCRKGSGFTCTQKTTGCAEIKTENLGPCPSVIPPYTMCLCNGNTVTTEADSDICPAEAPAEDKCGGDKGNCGCDSECCSYGTLTGECRDSCASYGMEKLAEPGKKCETPKCIESDMITRGEKCDCNGALSTDYFSRDSSATEIYCCQGAFSKSKCPTGFCSTHKNEYRSDPGQYWACSADGASIAYCNLDSDIGSFVPMSGEKSPGMCCARNEYGQRTWKKTDQASCSKCGNVQSCSEYPIRFPESWKDLCKDPDPCGVGPCLIANGGKDCLTKNSRDNCLATGTMPEGEVGSFYVGRDEQCYECYREADVSQWIPADDYLNYEMCNCYYEAEDNYYPAEKPQLLTDSGTKKCMICHRGVSNSRWERWTEVDMSQCSAQTACTVNGVTIQDKETKCVYGDGREGGGDIYATCNMGTTGGGYCNNGCTKGELISSSADSDSARAQKITAKCGTGDRYECTPYMIDGVKVGKEGDIRVDQYLCEEMGSCSNCYQCSGGIWTDAGSKCMCTYNSVGMYLGDAYLDKTSCKKCVYTDDHKAVKVTDADISKCDIGCIDEKHGEVVCKESDGKPGGNDAAEYCAFGKTQKIFCYNGCTPGESLGTFTPVSNVQPNDADLNSAYAATKAKCGESSTAAACSNDALGEGRDGDIKPGRCKIGSIDTCCFKCDGTKRAWQQVADSVCQCSKSDASGPKSIYPGLDYARARISRTDKNIKMDGWWFFSAGSYPNVFSMDNSAGHCWTCMMENNRPTWVAVDDELSSCYKSGCSYNTHYPDWVCFDNGAKYGHCLGNDNLQVFDCDCGCGENQRIVVSPTDPFKEECNCN